MSPESLPEPADQPEPIASEPSDTIPAPEGEPAPNVEDFIAPAEPVAEEPISEEAPAPVPEPVIEPTKPKIPEYNLRENISAVKIAGVQLAGASILIVPREEGIPSFTVSREWAAGHNPQPGNYCVLRDGKPHHIVLAADFEAAYATVL